MMEDVCGYEVLTMMKDVGIRRDRELNRLYTFLRRVLSTISSILSDQYVVLT